MQVHWMKQETIDKLFKNSANCMSDRTGKGVYVHNIGACSIFSKEHQLVSSIYFCKNIFFSYFYIFID